MHQPGDSLYDAQMRKIDTIIAKADLKSTDKVLEVGCGWGAFAIRAVQQSGCSWIGLTLSKEQLAIATQQIKAAGLQVSVLNLLNPAEHARPESVVAIVEHHHCNNRAMDFRECRVMYASKPWVP